MFKDETNYYAAQNCNNVFNRQIGGQIYASSKTLYSSCYDIPSTAFSSFTMIDQTSNFQIASISSGSWQNLTGYLVIKLTNDTGLIKSLNMTHLRQNTSCPVYSHTGDLNQPTKRFINYVSGISRQFNFLFSSQVCIPATSSQTFSYSLENESNSGLQDSMRFMTINPQNGTISFNASSLPSNFTHNVTAKVSVNSIGVILQQGFTLYDLRLFFADLQNFTMLIGEQMSNKTSWYNMSLNLLNLSITLNGTSLPAAPYFIQHDSVNKNLTIAPTNIMHFGLHTLRLNVSDAAGYFYEHVVQVNVRNRAPTFSQNITNANYSTTLNNITSIILPTIVNPDLGIPWVRVISTQSFITFIGSGTDILMRVNAKNLYEDIKYHNVTIEVFIPNYPNTTMYWINLTILNTLPKFEMPLADYEMGLYWNKNYKLPKYIDPDGGSVSVRWAIVTNFDFIKFEPQTYTFTFNPMEVNMIGQYNIMVTLTDFHKGTYSEDFTLRVHRPPMFSVRMKKIYTINIGSVFELELPLYETDGIDTFHSPFPDFVIFDKFVYTFKPTMITRLGIYTIKGMLQNKWGALDFDFKIEVKNYPPTLTMNPKDFSILQDTIFTLVLPPARDPEDQPITIKMSEAREKSLPQFITFDPLTKEYTLAPNKKTKLGIYMIQVDVYDSMNYYNTYYFKVQVLDSTFLNKEQQKDKQAKISQIIDKKSSEKFQMYQAKLIIQQVTRDGRATLKIVARNQMTGELAIQVTNKTFSIGLLRGDQVRYEVDSIIKDTGTVEIKLLFADPSSVSNKMVRHAEIQHILQEQDKLQVQVIKHLEFENDKMYVELKE